MNEQTHPERTSPLLVSVVIPCYNQARFLGEAIESVLVQSHPNFEIIVVDDGSPDDTSEVASRYEEVRLIRQENQGLSGARNRGLEEAMGEYVVFLDADDRLLPEALEVGVRELEARPECALVAGNYTLLEEDGSPVGEEPLLAASERRPRPPRRIGEDVYLTIMSRKYHILPGTVMYRRHVFESVGQFNTKLNASEDYDLYFRVARRFPVYCHDTVVLEARRHGANMTRDHGRMLKATLEVLRSQKAYARRDEVYRAAYRAGVRKAYEEHGVPLASIVRSHVHKREWRWALSGALLLAKYYPRGLLLLVDERPLLERQLREREKQVREKQRRLVQLRSALRRERRRYRNRTNELRGLKKRNRQLEQSQQELRRKLRAVESARAESQSGGGPDALVRRGIKGLWQIARRARARSEKNALILLYHRVAEVNSDPWSLAVTPQRFAEQLEVLEQYASPIRLQQLVQTSFDDLPERSVVVTFDDGYADNLYNAKPLLERYDVPATVFLTTGYAGCRREFWWDELDRLLLQPGTLPGTLCLDIGGNTYRCELDEATHYSEEASRRYRLWRARKDAPTPRHRIYRSLCELLNPLPEEERQQVLNELLSWAGAESASRPTHRALTLAEIVTLAGGELVDIGAHTVTHPALSTLPPVVQREEIHHSKTWLEQTLGRKVNGFAYPYGGHSDYTAETIKIVREAGFSHACSNFPGLVKASTDQLQLPRVNSPNLDGERFAEWLSKWLSDGL